MIDDVVDVGKVEAEQRAEKSDSLREDTEPAVEEPIEESESRRLGSTADRGYLDFGDVVAGKAGCKVRLTVIGFLGFKSLREVSDCVGD